jgi:hypothetical protein
MPATKADQYSNACGYFFRRRLLVLAGLAVFVSIDILIYFECPRETHYQCTCRYFDKDCCHESAFSCATKCYCHKHKKGGSRDQAGYFTGDWFCQPKRESRTLVGASRVCFWACVAMTVLLSIGLCLCFRKDEIEFDKALHAEQTATSNIYIQSPGRRHGTEEKTTERAEDGLAIPSIIEIVNGKNS